MFNEGQKSSINTLLGACILCVHPVDDVPFVPDDRPRTQLNLLWEGCVAYAEYMNVYPIPVISTT